MSGHRDSIYALCRLDEKRFLTGSADGQVVLWTPFEHEDGLLWMQLTEPVYSLHASDKFVYAGSGRGVIYRTSLDDAKDLRAIKAHEAGIFAILSFQEGVVTASGDGTVAFWDESMNLKVRYSISNKSVRSLAALTDGTFLCGCSDWKIYKLHPEKGITDEFSGHEQTVFSLAVDAVRGFVYSAGRDAQLMQRNAEGSVLNSLPAHMYSIHAVDVNLTNGLLVSGSMDKTIKIWNHTPFELIKVVDYDRYAAHRNCVNKVLWIDANHVISCADDRTAMVFRIEIIQDHDIK